MKILILAFILVLLPTASYSKTKAELPASFSTAPQAVIDWYLCQKTGERCIASQSANNCYIESIPCDEMIIESDNEKKGDSQATLLKIKNTE
jgi:hypothetical protein